MVELSANEKDGDAVRHRQQDYDLLVSSTSLDEVSTLNDCY